MSVAIPKAAVPEAAPDFCLGPRVFRAVQVRPYERAAGEPLYRPLAVYTLDPSASRRLGAETTAQVPFERLEPGPTGRLFKVDNLDGARGVRYHSADLDDPFVLMNRGYKPSSADPRFHQQMVYAVCSSVYEVFRRALGRDPVWGFGAHDCENATHQDYPQLLLRPHAGEQRNAYYDKEKGELCFGYYRADEVAGRNLPGGFVFTCLSHDIVAHEVTHALLDGLRAHFDIPSSPDVLAFHEAFADLVAIFQHFRHDALLKDAVARSRGALRDKHVLNALADQFGKTTGSGRALRSALLELDAGETPSYSAADAPEQPHERGSLLVSAVFEAFFTLYERKTADLFALATGGTGCLPEGDIPGTLRDALADVAEKLAAQFLNICIRAVDYCPPVDVSFGDYLRAVITADYDLVPDDPWAYREAWIDAFAAHGIYPQGVGSLSEEAVRWQPASGLPEIAGLRFGALEFDGDPARPADASELTRQATALGEVVAHPDYLAAFALVPPGQAADGSRVYPPCVESVRALRRVGPNGQVAFDLVAEVTQRRVVEDGVADGARSFTTYGGATVILGARGEVRYVIGKNVMDEARLHAQRRFMASPVGQHYWQGDGAGQVPAHNLFSLLHRG